MIEKQKLIKLLEDCVRLEGEAVPLYARYATAPRFFDVFEPEDRERVKKTLKALADDSKSHHGIFELLLSKAREFQGDVL